MIKSVRLINFKNFADETLKLGPFTVIVGANASGKSNIRDAFRFLHGIGRGYTLAEIVGGKIGVGGQLEWESIRGAPDEIVRITARRGARKRSFSTEIEFETGGRIGRHSIEIGYNRSTGEGFSLLTEKLIVGGVSSFNANLTAGGRVRVEIPEEKQHVFLNPTQPVVSQIWRRDLTTQTIFQLPFSALDANLALVAMRFFELNTDKLREPSVPGAVDVGDFGQNLPGSIEQICENDDRKDVLASWLRELTPMDVRDFNFPRDPSGRIHLEMIEGKNRKVSAFSASDGTLRFLAMLAALLNEDEPVLYFFEEIDNGIHPARLALLVDLIETQTRKRDVQVVTTTHSPDLLSMLSESSFMNTSVVYRHEDSANGIIRAISELPNAHELRKSQGLGTLHGSGWFEDVLELSGTETNRENSKR